MSDRWEGHTRRALLGSATAVAAGAVTGGRPAAATGQVPALWREFTRTPFTHPQIRYIGRAGQRAGAAHFPRRPVVADVRAYGATADGSADSAPAINRAVAAAGRTGGGTVLIPPGTYRLDGLIHVGHSNVVLRGAGSARTKLYATRNLTELIGVYGSAFEHASSASSFRAEAEDVLALAPRRGAVPPLKSRCLTTELSDLPPDGRKVTPVEARVRPVPARETARACEAGTRGGPA